MRTMKRKGVVILLLLAAMVLLATNQALALVGSNSGGSGFWLDGYVDQNLSGSKVTGTITVYWHPNGTHADCGELNDIVYIVRVNSALWPAWQYKGYSGVSQLCADDVYTLQGNIFTFLGPIITNITSAKKPWSGMIKSYWNYMDSDHADVSNGMDWIMFDFVTAAK